jgi:hypothetical protein
MEALASLRETWSPDPEGKGPNGADNRRGKRSSAEAGP